MKITRASQKPTEPLSRLILFGKERRLIHSQESRNNQVAISRRSARALSRATTDISPVARSRAETKSISLTRAAATPARQRSKEPPAIRCAASTAANHSEGASDFDGGACDRTTARKTKKGCRFGLCRGISLSSQCTRRVSSNRKRAEGDLAGQRPRWRM